VDGAITLIWCLAGLIGFLLLYKLGEGLRHFLLLHFGIEATAVVIASQRYNQDGETYLQGYYTFTDAYGHDHSFCFRICSYWPVDEQWDRVMQLYTQGAQNQVRYFRWLPMIHEVQSTTIKQQALPARGTRAMRLAEPHGTGSPSMKLR
jgi:hypothetical protein